MRGPNCKWWRGGITDKDHVLRHNREYREWRRLVFAGDNFTCQRCGARSEAGKRVYLQAHHKRPWAKFPELRYDVTNGVTLCKPCHQVEHPDINLNR